MAVTLVAVCGVGAERAVQRRETAERELQTVSISRDLFNAMQEIRLERGGLDGALATPAPLSPATLASGSSPAPRPTDLSTARSPSWPRTPRCAGAR